MTGGATLRATSQLPATATGCRCVPLSRAGDPPAGLAAAADGDAGPRETDASEPEVGA